METSVYVDVLVVINYIINMLLILCTARLCGRTTKRRRIVAAALFGALCSLTIFLPSMGFLLSVITKLFISTSIVLIGFSYINIRTYLAGLFVFFVVNFFFAGVMLGVWVTFSPIGMFYSNGVVYFDISSFYLLTTTIIAYVVLSVANRITRKNRLDTSICDVTIFHGGKTARVFALVDTGNSLCEPFSGVPVMVCSVKDLATILPMDIVVSVLEGNFFSGSTEQFSLPLRLVPFQGVGECGVIPAFKPDKLVIQKNGGNILVEQVYIGLCRDTIGDSRYSAILSPELVHIQLV